MQNWLDLGEHSRLPSSLDSSSVATLVCEHYSFIGFISFWFIGVQLKASVGTRFKSHCHHKIYRHYKDRLNFWKQNGFLSPGWKLRLLGTQETYVQCTDCPQLSPPLTMHLEMLTQYKVPLPPRIISVGICTTWCCYDSASLLNDIFGIYFHLRLAKLNTVASQFTKGFEFPRDRK